jgi:hypothetical protein
MKCVTIQISEASKKRCRIWGDLLMAYDSRIYRVLVASPSDVHEEREVAVRVMQDWNNLHSYTRRTAVLPLRWETHTAPAFNVRPQEVINRQIVDDCDLVVGIFWTKLGSPTGEADSGTLEEIERVAKAGKPVMLYFSNVPIPPDSVEAAQIERLRAFKQAIQRNALIETFKSSLEFRDKFANQLEIKIREMQEADNKGKPHPLVLRFLKLPSRELIGNTLETSVRVLQIQDDPSVTDGPIREEVQRIAHSAQEDGFTVPLVLSIGNSGPTGIRNVYTEVSIVPSKGPVSIFDTDPNRKRSVFWSVDNFWTSKAAEPTEIESALANISGTGLKVEGDCARFSFEWEALQPQRIRLIEPIVYLRVPGACSIDINAKVYADNFNLPIELNAHMDVIEQIQHVPISDFVAKAERSLKDKVLTSITYNLPSTLLTEPVIPESTNEPSPAESVSDPTTNGKLRRGPRRMAR